MVSSAELVREPQELLPNCKLSSITMMSKVILAMDEVILKLKKTEHGAIKEHYRSISENFVIGLRKD